MAACSIFDEDEVCIPTSCGGFKYGLVVESSEYVSSDEDDEDNFVQRGQVKVAWHPSGDETVISEKRVILTNRSLMPGDVVRRLISGEESQRGFVQSCRMKCHVRVLGTDHYIYNVDSEDIDPIQEFDPEPEVTLDSWVGHVLEVNEEITVRFPCGARCGLSNAGVLDLEDVQDKRKSDSEFVMRNFYPGQELAGMHEDYEDATWLYTSNVRGPKCKVKSLLSANVIVEEVKTQNVDVNWICKGFTRTGAGTDKLKSPPNLVEGDDLKRLRRLDCFKHCHMQIGDKGYYVVKEADTVLHKISPRKHITPDIIQLRANENILVIGTSAGGIHVKRRVADKNRDKIEAGGDNYVGIGDVAAKKENDDTNKGDMGMTDQLIKNDHGVINDDNGVINDDKGVINVDKGVIDDDNGVIGDDEYEDLEDNNSVSGSDTSSVQSGPESPAPRRKTRKRPFLSALKRLKGKVKKKSHRVERDVRPGDSVPIELWYTFSTCNVMWQDGCVEENIPSPELFPIHHLDDLEFFPGDFVVDNNGNTGTDYGVVVSSDHRQRTVLVKWMKLCLSGKSNKPDEQDPVELSVFDIKDHPDYKFRCGHTVIRVGGYEGDTDLEAVGQVYRLDAEGTIQVWWPDSTITKCYPQDLYIIGDEFQSESGSESDEWTDEEEEEEEEEEQGSDVSWETENEDTETDTENDSKKNKSNQLWTVSDSKKKELDVLLDRAQAAVSGLLNIFVNVAGPFFKNSRQVFHDILAIFKRCKEVEKILRSSFFDDDEIADLISDIKDELRKEKTAKLARQIAEVYKYRTRGVEEQLNNKSNTDQQTDNKSDADNWNENHKRDSGIGNGAVGGNTEPTEESEVCKKLKNALIDYGTNIDDPIMQIIFDTSLHATIAENAQKSLLNFKKQSHNESASDSVWFSDAKGDTSSANNIVKDIINEERVTDIIQTVIDSVCDNSDRELQAAFQSVKEKVKLACDGVQVNTLEVECPDGKQMEQTSSKGDSESKSQTGAQKIEQIGSEDKSEDTIILPPSHRTLCIRVCKALNVRLLHVKQEVNRKWLAYKFGCDENASDFELFQKMQATMIESVEHAQGPLQLDCEINNDRAVAGTECIKELESLEERRTSPESEISEPSVEKEVDNEAEAVEHITNGDIAQKGFEVCSETPISHHFRYREQKPSNPNSFSSAVRKEWMLLRTSLPDGIIVKVFEDRMDVLSVMIVGPENTPYEDGLFVFDVQLPANFPNSPPIFHYHSFCNDRLNPNLYEDGKVCVSLLGTWSGKGNELWTNRSSVLQVLVSIQGLILVPEPYFNEAGYEKQRGSQHSQENSRMYNEMAVLKLVQSMTNMAITPPAAFLDETKSHLCKHAYRMINRIEKWVELSNLNRMDTNTISETNQHLCNGDQTSLAEVTVPVTMIDGEPVQSGEATHNNAMGTGGTTDLEPPKSGNDTCREPVNTGEVTHLDATKTGEATHMVREDFPLLPASKGFCLAVRKHLTCFKEVCAAYVLDF